MKIILKEDDREEGGGGEEETLISTVNLNYYSKFGNTCLHEAINISKLDLIKLLLEQNADINLPNYDMQTNY
jgi:ankyrin repeat protein